MALEPAASSLLLRLTQARIGDTLHDGNGTVVTVVNAFTTVNPATEGIVRAGCVPPKVNPAERRDRGEANATGQQSGVAGMAGSQRFRGAQPGFGSAS